jgi:hypothetical protein
MVRHWPLGLTEGIKRLPYLTGNNRCTFRHFTTTFIRVLGKWQDSQ